MFIRDVRLANILASIDDIEFEKSILRAIYRLDIKYRHCNEIALQEVGRKDAFDDELSA